MPDQVSEAFAERGDGIESDLSRNTFDRVVGSLEQKLRLAEPRVMEPLQRRCTDLFLEAAVERAGAHRCLGCDCRDVELLPEVLFHPVQ